MVAKLRAAAHELVDFGAHQLSPDDDYPDVVIPEFSGAERHLRRLSKVTLLEKGPNGR
jgi:hypothetical protein